MCSFNALDTNIFMLLIDCHWAIVIVIMIVNNLKRQVFVSLIWLFTHKWDFFKIIISYSKLINVFCSKENRFLGIRIGTQDLFMKQQKTFCRLLYYLLIEVFLRWCINLEISNIRFHWILEMILYITTSHWFCLWTQNWYGSFFFPFWILHFSRSPMYWKLNVVFSFVSSYFLFMLLYIEISIWFNGTACIEFRIMLTSDLLASNP